MLEFHHNHQQTMTLPSEGKKLTKTEEESMKIALDDSQRIGLKLEGLALAKKFYSMTEAYDFENDGTQALMKILRSLNAN